MGIFDPKYSITKVVLDLVSRFQFFFVCVCVTLDKFYHTSGYRFPHLKNEEIGFQVSFYPGKTLSV